VVDDFRFSVVRPYIKEWNLQIRDIKWDDQGRYRCTINTNPVKSKIVMLHVKGKGTASLPSVKPCRVANLMRLYLTMRARIRTLRDFYENSRVLTQDMRIISALIDKKILQKS